MFYFKKITLFITIGYVCLSCIEPKRSQHEFFAVDSLLDAQVIRLTNQKTTIQKTASINGKEESSIVEITDSTSWARELEVFRQFRLVNSPIYIDKYQIDDGVQDLNSNLRILSIVTDEKLPITKLKIYYQDTKDKIKKVEGSYFESNTIFSGTRNLSLEFQDLQGQLALTKYTVIGGQKMVRGDSVKYHIEGIIDYQ